MERSIGDYQALEMQFGQLADRATTRKARLFACACCRKLWHLLKHDEAREAVIVGEKAADGLISSREMMECGTKLNRLLHNDKLVGAAECLADFCVRPIGTAIARRDILNACLQQATILLIYDDGLPPDLEDSFYVCYGDPEHMEALQIMVDLMAELVGYSQPKSQNAEWPRDICILATALYDGEPCAPILRDALLDAGMDELAAHFATDWHPKGCWVVDRILKRK